MKNFAHIDATTLDDAVETLRQYGGKAVITAGGTDLLGKMKDEILPVYPEAVVNIKTIPELDYIRKNGESLSIGSCTRLEDIAHNETVKSNYRCLAEAAGRTASTHLREMGTLGGNICQDIRCWYYRNPHNRFPCLRKGGGRCYAIDGENRYHSIFGGSVEKGCYAVHPSDTAPALIALDASIRTTKRTMAAEDFFAVSVRRTTVLEPDEIVTEIILPRPPGQSSFLKFALRKTIDFPIVNCAAALSLSDSVVSSARICLNSVYVTPYRPVDAETALVGKALTEETAEAAGLAAVARARPMTHNEYMVQIAKVYVKRAVLACR
jgi:xanthine dehydrogenase YagS FAD-binding subunit